MFLTLAFSIESMWVRRHLSAEVSCSVCSHPDDLFGNTPALPGLFVLPQRSEYDGIFLFAVKPRYL